MANKENNIVKEIIEIIADRVTELEPSTNIEDHAIEHELCLLIRKIGERFGTE